MVSSLIPREEIFLKLYFSLTVEIEIVFEEYFESIVWIVKVDYLLTFLPLINELNLSIQVNEINLFK